jgi:phosphatidylinositol-3-phosphatase
MMATANVASASSVSALSTSLIQKVMQFWDENATWSQYVAGQAPYTYSLAKRFAFASDYTTFNNNSLPNYMVGTSGSACGFTTDEAPPSKYLKANRSIFDSLTAAGKSWKWYAEDLPGPCPITVGSKGLYVARHVAPLYYRSVAKGPGCANVVDLSTLDLTNLPVFSGVTPNIYHDGHTPASVPNTDAFNQSFFPPLLASSDFTTGKLAVFVVTDNGKPFTVPSPFIVLWAGLTKPVVVSAKRTHYDMLHQIEKLLGLPFLTPNDKNAVGFPEIFT